MQGRARTDEETIAWNFLKIRQYESLVIDLANPRKPYPGSEIEKTDSQPATPHRTLRKLSLSGARVWSGRDQLSESQLGPLVLSPFPVLCWETLHVVDGIK